MDTKCNTTYIYLTPAKGRRLVALHKKDSKGKTNWIEIYAGESVLVLQEYVNFLKHKGLVKGMSKKIYKTMEEAENAN